VRGAPTRATANDVRRGRGGDGQLHTKVVAVAFLRVVWTHTNLRRVTPSGAYEVVHGVGGIDRVSTHTRTGPLSPIEAHGTMSSVYMYNTQTHTCYSLTRRAIAWPYECPAA
jgi:hypothetical protein